MAIAFSARKRIKLRSGRRYHEPPPVGTRYTAYGRFCPSLLPEPGFTMQVHRLSHHVLAAPSRMRGTALGTLALVLSAVAPAPAIAQPTGCITIEQSSAVNSISADGLRAVGVWQDAVGTMFSYTWCWEEGRCDQAWGEGLEWAVLVGMSADGTVIAGMVMPDDSLVNEGYAWHGEVCEDMRSPGLDWMPGPQRYLTEGISGDGSTVYGNIDENDSNGAMGGFLWRPDTAEVIHLDLMPQFWGDSIVFLGSMNSDHTGDRITGTLYDEYFFANAAIWDGQGTGRLLPLAEGYSLARTYGHGISRNGRYVVGAHGLYAAMWKDEQPPELLLFGPVNESSSLFMIADHGRMGIGWRGGYYAWTREEGGEPIANYLSRHGAPLPEGWNVLNVSSISADGSVVAGNLRRSNPTRFLGFIAYTNYRPCFADFNNDGGVDGRDVEDFFLAWESGDLDGDVNQDGGTDGGDVERFFIDWEAGGCGDS
jgi:hypothetical protein